MLLVIKIIQKTTRCLKESHLSSLTADQTESMKDTH